MKLVWLILKFPHYSFSTLFTHICLNKPQVTNCLNTVSRDYTPRLLKLTFSPQNEALVSNTINTTSKNAKPTNALNTLSNLKQLWRCLCGNFLVETHWKSAAKTIISTISPSFVLFWCDFSTEIPLTIPLLLSRIWHSSVYFHYHTIIRLSPPCFYSSPTWANWILTLDTAFCIFCQVSQLT